MVNPPIVVDSKLDMGEWLNNVKVLAHVTNIFKISGQKDKLTRALEGPQDKTLDNAIEEIPPSNNVVLEGLHVLLHSDDPRKEDHPPFYVSLLVNYLLM